MPSERRANLKSGRRRWQLRLRTLLLFVTLLSCGLAYWTYEVRALRRQRLALKQVLTWQETLETPQDHWLQSPQKVVSSALPWWLALSEEGPRQRVTALSFDVRSYDDGFEEPSSIDDAALATIGVFTELESLALPRSRVTDHGLVALTSLRRLKYLDLSGVKVTDAGLLHLGKLPALETLLLNDTQIQGAGLQHLGACRIRELELRGTPLQADQVTSLRNLQSLEKLTVQSATLRRLDLHDLNGLRELVVGVDAAEVSLAVERLPALQRVALHCTETGSLRKLSLVDLGALTELQASVSGGPARTEGDTEFVLRHLPKLRIVVMLQGRLALGIAPRLAAFESLEELSLADMGRDFDDELISRFAKHPQLRKLRIGATGVGDRGLAALSTAPNLEELSLRAERITPLGVSSLSAAPRLRRLNLGGLRGDDDPGPALQQLTGLEAISLRDCDCPAVTLLRSSSAAETSFAKLKHIDLEGGGVESVRIARLPELQTLSLQLPEARVFEIGPLPRLERLDVSFAAPQVVEQFRMVDLPELTWLSLQCGSTGARLPAETFEHLPSFSKLRAGIVWGLQLPDHAKSQLVRFHETTGVRLH